MEKKLLTVDELESQVALELPERETLAHCTLVVVNVVVNNVITLIFEDINVCLATQDAVLSNANMRLIQVCA